MYSRIKIFEDFADIYPALKIFIIEIFCSALEVFKGKLSSKFFHKNFQISDNPQNFISSKICHPIVYNE